MSADLDVTVETKLRRVGQRYTPQRRALIRQLVRAGRPRSIPEILATDAHLKQSSVYRNLAALEHADVVRRVPTDEEYGRYELAESLIGHHHHLVCASCGTMRDVEVPGTIEATLDDALDRIATSAGFARIEHRLDLVGLCAGCARSGS